jgi:hypothetical protein
VAISAAFEGGAVESGSRIATKLRNAAWVFSPLAHHSYIDDKLLQIDE